MPGVEVLPNSTSIKAPGWALVPDTGRPQIAAQATTKRGRAARASNVGGGDTSVRQQNTVLKHLADLDRDSHRDVLIPIPKDNAGRGMSLDWSSSLVERLTYIIGSKKTTTNVRRILMSQKTFANHLADEEAALAQQQQAGPPSLSRVPTLRPTGSIPNLKQAWTAQVSSDRGSAPHAKDVVMSGTASTGFRDPLDDEPLLMVNVPKAPSEAELQALVSSPPLPYNMARSDPPPPHRPQRHFCEICGYWGTIKCMKCGARVCGLECKGAHDDGRCLKFYA